MSKFKSRRREIAGRRARGITLIELMIGMLIGLMAVLVISQVMLTAEGQKRTTTGGADAQVNGALSIYAIQRDLEIAGYGFSSSPGIVGCPINAQFNGAAPAQFATRLAPVVITRQGLRPAGSVGDSIRMLASSKASYSVPTLVTAPGLPINGVIVPVASSLGFAQGDLVLAAIDATQPCWVFQVTGAPTATVIPRANNAATWNTAGTPTQVYGSGNVLVNLGTLVDNRFEIGANNVLQSISFDSSNPGSPITREVQADIVQLRAFYGRDTNTTPGVTVSTYDTATPVTSADWQRVLSVRLIVVARSSQYEQQPVTLSNPKWEVGTTPSVVPTPTTDIGACPAPSTSQCLTLDVGADAAGDVPAKHYRYKIFETIVPLRNMVWSS
jgi:type IV pilus assembly protein PilW